MHITLHNINYCKGTPHKHPRRDLVRAVLLFSKDFPEVPSHESS